MYRIETTTPNGDVISAITIADNLVRTSLIFSYGLDAEQIDFAKQITEKNPGVPYDLHVADEQGNIKWTGRLIKLHNSH